MLIFYVAVECVWPTESPSGVSLWARDAQILESRIMYYATQKTILVVFCSLFMAIGVGCIVYGEDLTMLGGIMFFFVGLFIMITNLKQLSRFQRKTYEWYKKEHHQHFQGNNVSCYACGSPRINARALMNRTFHREHFCTQCGKTLYYSREQS